MNIRLILATCVLFACFGCTAFKGIGYDDYVKDLKYWRARASFYNTSYSGYNNAEKVEMLVREMKGAGVDPVVEYKHTDVVVIHVFDGDGHQVWPVKYKGE
jgi:hypothetical protein